MPDSPMSQSVESVTLPVGYRLLETKAGINKRFTATVECMSDGGSAVGYSWTSYQNAIVDAVARLESLED